MKECTLCNETKEHKFFSKHRSTGDGYQYRCKSCVSDNNKRKSDNPDFNREKSYRSRYGISLKDYNTLFEHQKGVCKICKNPEKPSYRNGHLSVDHCHTTSLVRGLLCHTCNMGLGHFKDDITNLENAKQYLRDAYGE